MWFHVAECYDSSLMPLFIWVIFLLVGLCLLVIGCIASKCRLLLKSSRNAIIIPASLWFIHCVVLWYTMRVIVNYGWFMQMNISVGQKSELWRNITIACSEMGIVSTLVLILATILIVILHSQQAASQFQEKMG
jgi:hypothetical protein